jgi:hypothetical protein
MSDVKTVGHSTAVPKGHIAIEVPLDLYEMQKLACMVHDAEDNGVSVNYSLFRSVCECDDENSVWLIMLTDKATGTMLSPIKSFSINSDEEALADFAETEDDKWEHDVFLKDNHFFVLLAKSDEFPFLHFAADCKNARKDARTLSCHDMRSLIRESDADIVRYFAYSQHLLRNN